MGKAAQKCTKCKKHGVEELVKLHKQYCPYRTCGCKICEDVDNKRQQRALQTRIRRERRTRQLLMEQRGVALAAITGPDNIISKKEYDDNHPPLHLDYTRKYDGGACLPSDSPPAGPTATSYQHLVNNMSPPMLSSASSNNSPSPDNYHVDGHTDPRHTDPRHTDLHNDLPHTDHYTDLHSDRHLDNHSEMHSEHNDRGHPTNHPPAPSHPYHNDLHQQQQSEPPPRPPMDHHEHQHQHQHHEQHHDGGGRDDHKEAVHQHRSSSTPSAATSAGPPPPPSPSPSPGMAGGTAEEGNVPALLWHLRCLFSTLCWVSYAQVAASEHQHVRRLLTNTLNDLVLMVHQYPASNQQHSRTPPALPANHQHIYHPAAASAVVAAGSRLTPPPAPPLYSTPHRHHHHHHHHPYRWPTPPPHTPLSPAGYATPSGERSLAAASRTYSPPPSATVLYSGGASSPTPLSAGPHPHSAPSASAYTEETRISQYIRHAHTVHRCDEHRRLYPGEHGGGESVLQQATYTPFNEQQAR